MKRKCDELGIRHDRLSLVCMDQPHLLNYDLIVTTCGQPVKLDMNHSKIKFIIASNQDDNNKYEKTITLTNNTISTAAFTMDTSQPELFSISLPNSSYTLQPKQQAHVTIRFTPRSQSASSHDAHLRIHFDNGQVQHFDIFAQVHTSQLTVRPLQLNFGTLRRYMHNPVDCVLTLPLSIHNQSRVARGKWEIKRLSDEESDDVFVMSEMTGSTSYSSGLRQGTSVVTVEFRPPKKNKSFSARYQVVALNESDSPAQVIDTFTCTGSAQFDEFAEEMDSMNM
ncbi:hypothetical protein AKO1_009696 [Acrasis kona]|uniref:Uncharacterized protein n=1 Tax=Acrasis kona TaxID=1008807 RepID=A0AAW2ZMK3_9EUKA